MYGGWFNYNRVFIREAQTRKDQIIMIQYERLKRVSNNMQHLTVYFNAYL